MMPLQLESFSDEAVPAQDTDVPPQGDKGFEAGFAQGHAAACAEMGHVHLRSAEAMVALIEEAGLTYAEAQLHVLRQLRGFLEMLLSNVLPQVAQPLLVAHLLEELLAEARPCVTQPNIRLHVEPQLLPQIEEELRHANLQNCTLSADPRLSSGSVRLELSGDERLLDPRALIDRFEQETRAFFDLIPVEQSSLRRRHVAG